MKYIDEVTMSLTLTDTAADKIRGLLENEDNSALNLRIFVSGGGCSGFQYGFTFDDEIKESDEVVDSHGVKLLVDPMSLELHSFRNKKSEVFYALFAQHLTLGIDYSTIS